MEAVARSLARCELRRGAMRPHDTGYDESETLHNGTANKGTVLDDFCASHLTMHLGDPFALNRSTVRRDTNHPPRVVIAESPFDIPPRPVRRLA